MVPTQLALSLNTSVPRHPRLRPVCPVVGELGVEDELVAGLPILGGSMFTKADWLSTWLSVKVYWLTWFAAGAGRCDASDGHADG